VEVAEAVEDAIAKSIGFVSPLLAWIESLAHGVVVPRPRLPFEPTIMSLGRRPETARDDDGGEVDLDAGFRDID
jgi:hypothetical protein